MANIIIEGPDNAGKSYLIKAISDCLGWPIQISGGREKWPGEINQRILRYLNVSGHIFDRHPVISQDIYRSIHNGEEVDPELKRRFYSQENLIIYCRPNDKEGLKGQILKAYDTPEFQSQLNENFTQLVSRYDSWSTIHAHITRTKYDDPRRTMQLIARSFINDKRRVV